MPPPSEAVDRNPRSLSGIVLWSMVGASVFYIVGFSSVGWEDKLHNTDTEWVGLWSTCTSASHWYNEKDWFKATQGMMVLGLILLLGSLVSILTYMFIGCSNKNFQLKIFTALDFAAVAFMVIGIAIYGSKHQFHLNWSFAFCIIGACVCTVAGILSIVQLMMK